MWHSFPYIQLDPRSHTAQNPAGSDRAGVFPQLHRGTEHVPPGKQLLRMVLRCNEKTFQNTPTGDTLQSGPDCHGLLDTVADRTFPPTPTGGEVPGIEL